MGQRVKQIRQLRNRREYGRQMRYSTYSQKLGNGGVKKKPATLPKTTSLAKFSVTILTCAKAEGKWFDNLAMREP